jgi:hypothetical protein
MIQVKLSNGTIVDATLITKAALWDYPPKLEIDLSQNEPRIAVYGDDASKDAALLDKIHDDNHLNFPVFRM